MNITKEEKKYCQLFYFLPSLLISISIGFICKLKEEPASSLQDFHTRKVTCKSPRTKAVTVDESKDYRPFTPSTNITVSCPRPGTSEARGVKRK